jgi:hypothetical protein
MKRPSRGWGIKPLNNQGDYTDEFLALRNEALELAHEAVDRMVLAHTMEERERDKYINHILWLFFCKKINIEYQSFGL